MNTGYSHFNCVRRVLLPVVIVLTLLFTGCAQVPTQRTEDPSKAINLSETPVGIHVKKVGSGAGMTIVDITVRNNSGKFIDTLYIEVYPYDNDSRVGMTNNVFNSVNVGETLIVRKYVDSSGRSWDSWTSSHKIR